MFVGFEFLTAMVMKSSIFWDITPCSPLTVQQSSIINFVDSLAASRRR
jgi:hypothetical protein